MSPFTQLFSNPTINTICIAPLVLIFLDVLSGITRAVRSKQFQVRRLADFLGTVFVKYVATLAAVLLLWVLSGSTVAVTAAGTLGMATLSIAVAASILENLQMSSLPPSIERPLEEITKKVEDIADQTTTQHPLVSDFSPTTEMTAVCLRRIRSQAPTVKMPVVRLFS